MSAESTRVSQIIKWSNHILFGEKEANEANMALLIVILLLFIATNVTAAATPRAVVEDELLAPVNCPICNRVIRAVNYFSIKNNVKADVALDKYCKLTSLEVDEQRFCYNIETIKSDINRMLLMQADENRVCKKVNSINPDWCTVKQVKGDSDDKNKNTLPSKTRGVIYE